MSSGSEGTRGWPATGIEPQEVLYFWGQGEGLQAGSGPHPGDSGSAGHFQLCTASQPDADSASSGFPHDVCTLWAHRGKR